jgi:cyanate permease
VVGGTFLVAVWSWGLAFYGLGVYLVALSRQHGWSISAISVAITAFYLMGAGATASVGPVMRRLGAHRVVAGGVIAMAAGVAGLGSIDRLWQLYLALAAMSLGWACMSGAAINILVAPWFIRQRGMAVSLALTGASGGGILVAPALLALVAHWGFAAAVRTAALAMVVTLVPVAAVVFRRTPEGLGVGPDGDPAPSPATPSIPTPSAPRSAFFRTRRYWTISIAFALGLAAQVGVLTHLVSHLTPLLGAAGAGGALSLTTAAAITGRIPMGALADRLNRRTIAGLNFLAQVVGLVLLSLASSSAVVYAGCVLFGFGVGNVITLPGLLIEGEFPREQFAAIVSGITATNQLAFAFAPALIGILRDATGSYGVSLAVCATADLAAAGVVAFGRPRHAPA